ncbi:MAG TPA: pre-peptidase C-terminal domain-containing protein [Myxococcota bacterium]|nr:pre-peptidase C-terminal domain-containing protein [Myxococcota bacterium]HRY96519.1 pre-peptidase C-terminal domain-containing protein [Myxococcota bacterium]
MKLRMLSRVVLVVAAGLGGLAGCANHSPALVNIGNQAVETGRTLEFTVRAVDDDGDSLQFAADGLPAGATFEDLGDRTAIFRWTPIASDAGPDGRGQTYQVTFKVSDGIDTASETIIITVTLGGAGTGAPVFISPSDTTLDLSRTNQARLTIEVRDPDSSSIDISLVRTIEGSLFQTAPGSKLATFEWTPTAAQIAERPVWSFQVQADDHVNPPVTQDITILIKGGATKCEGTAPTLTHQELGDQKVAGDYPIQAVARDAESDISAVALYYLVDTGQGAGGSFEKRTMTSAGDEAWAAAIPNPGLSGETTATIHYYLCAVDTDDPATGACNLRTCLPAEGRYSFTAYAPGNDQCLDDDMEPNDAALEATRVEAGTYSGRKICAGDEDWYEVDVPAGYQFGAGIDHTAVNGELALDVFEANGTTMLASGQADGTWVIATLEGQPSQRTLLVRVRGGAEVENSYEFAVVIEQVASCEPDGYEPNDEPGDASVVPEGEYPNLTVCNDLDWYRFDLEQGDGLAVLIQFTQAQGDLDLWVIDEAALQQPQITPEVALCASTTENDDEVCELAAVPATGTYYVIVSPYNEARNTYGMTVLVTPATTTCTDDASEPNDTPAEATGLWDGQALTDRIVCANDDDWYMLYMYSGERLLVDATFTHADGDLDLKLYEAGVTPDTLVQHQLASSTSSQDNEHIEYVVVEDGDYYIRVYGYGGASNTYALLATIGR